MITALLPAGLVAEWSRHDELFDEDMARARAAMERAWLEATPVQDDTPPASAGPHLTF
jgi:hypothetical protein